MEKPIGIILAGGKSVRMGGKDKGLISVCGQPLIAHTIKRMLGQVSDIIISANRNINSYAALSYPVINDTRPDYKGPLAGIASIMDYIVENNIGKNNPEKYTTVFVAACDMPLLPRDFIQRVNCIALNSDYTTEQAYVAHDGKRMQHLCALLPLSTRNSLCNYIDSGHQKAQGWISSLNPAEISYSDSPDAFININTFDDIATLETRLNTDE